MRKEVLHVIPSLDSGGAERLLVDVVSRTSQEHFSHTVCVLKDAGTHGQQIIDDGHRLICLNLNGRRPWLPAARRISAIVGEIRPDLIVSWLLDASIAARLAVLFGPTVPLITTLHSTDYDTETIKAGNWPPLKVKALRGIDKFTSKLTKPFFVACSGDVAESYKVHLGLDNSEITVIHNFVDSASFKSGTVERQMFRSGLAIPSDAFVYTNVGRLDPQKGQIKLISAFARIVNDIPNAFLLLVGDGPLGPKLRDLVRSSGIGDRVRLAGRRDDIANCLAASDVFVFPSLVEGFGIALVEAMIQQTPCIASDLAVFREIIEDGVSGILVPGGTIEGFAIQMERLYEDPVLRASIGASGYTRASKEFSHKVVIPLWNKVLSEVGE